MTDLSKPASRAGAVRTGRRDVRASLLVVGVRVGGILVQTISLFVLTRALVPRDFGLFATVFTSIPIVRVVGPLGMDQLAMRGAFNDAHPDRASIFDAAIAGVVVNGILVSAFWLGAALWPRSELLASAGIASLAWPAVALSGLLAGFLRSQERNMMAQFPESIVLPSLILALVSAKAPMGGVTLSFCLLALPVAAWLTLLIYIGAAWSYLPFGATMIRLRRALALGSEARQVVLALALTAFSSRLPIIMSSIVLGPRGAAVLEVANRFGTLGTIITGSVATTFSPRFAKAHAEADVEQSRGLLRTAAFASAGGSAAIALVLAIGFPLLTGRLLPDFYDSSYPVLLLVSLATIVNAAFGPATSFLMMTGRASTLKWLSLAQLGVVALAGPILAALFGPIGLGIVIVCGALVRDGWAALIVRRAMEADRA